MAPAAPPGKRRCCARTVLLIPQHDAFYLRHRDVDNIGSCHPSSRTQKRLYSGDHRKSTKNNGDRAPDRK